MRIECVPETRYNIAVGKCFVVDVIFPAAARLAARGGFAFQAAGLSKS